MAQHLGTVYAALELDTSNWSSNLSKAENDMNKTAKKFESVGSGLTSIGKKWTTALSLPIIGAGAAMSKLAMDAEETENLFQISMGNMADEAETWTQSLGDSLGLNEYALKQQVGTLNTMFNSMQMSTKSSYDMSTSLTELANDMASFYNLPIEEAFNKIRAGMTGETEGLKALGILVDEATVKHYAYKEGIAKQGDELTQQQKVQARYIAIMDQTVKAQGDLARTLDSPTNKLRTMTNQVQETAAKYGELLLPMITNVVEKFTDVVEWLNNLDDGNKKIILTIGGVAAAIGPLLVTAGVMAGSISNIMGLYKIWTGVTAAQTAAQATLNTTMAVNPIGMVILAIGALVAAGVALYKNWDTIKYKLLEIWENIKMVGVMVFEGIKIAVLTFVKTSISAWEKLLGWLPGVSEKLGEAKAAIDGMIDESIQNAQTKVIETENNKRALSYEQSAERIEKAMQDIGKASDEEVAQFENDMEREKLARLGMVRNLEETTEQAVSVVQAGSSVVKEESKTLYEAVSNHLTGISNKVQSSIDIIEKKLELWSIKNHIVEESSLYLVEQLAVQTEKHDLLTQEISATQEALNQIIEAYGEGSEQALEYQNKLLDLQIAQANLGNEINKTTDALKKQHQTEIEISNDKIRIGNVEYDRKSMQDSYNKKKQKDFDKYGDEIADVARRNDADWNTAYDMWKQNELDEMMGKIPRYHSGGIVTNWISDMFKGLKSNEVPVIAEVGEKIIPKGQETSRIININIHGGDKDRIYQTVRHAIGGNI